MIQCIFSSYHSVGQKTFFLKYELFVMLTYFVDYFLPFSVWLPSKIFFAFSLVNVVLPIVSGSKKKSLNILAFPNIYDRSKYLNFDTFEICFFLCIFNFEIENHLPKSCPESSKSSCLPLLIFPLCYSLVHFSKLVNQHWYIIIN